MWENLNSFLFAFEPCAKEWADVAVITSGRNKKVYVKRDGKWRQVDRPVPRQLCRYHGGVAHYRYVGIQYLS
jgi:hypothetical protein